MERAGMAGASISISVENICQALADRMEAIPTLLCVDAPGLRAAASRPFLKVFRI